MLYGLNEAANVRAENAVEAGLKGVRFTVVAGEQRAEVKLGLLGLHNVSNALAAIAVGLQSGMSLAECAAAAAELKAGDRRGELLHWHGATIINDSYNSNPKALDAMVDALLSIPAKRHLVIAGEMLELGPDAVTLHSNCGYRMAQRGVDVLVGVRGNARAMVVGASSSNQMDASFVDSAEAAGVWMAENLREGDAVLLKASRGVKLERALAALV